MATSVEKEQLAVSYAAFVLSGTGAEVNQESLNAVLQAAGVKVSNGLVNAVSRALKGKNVSDFFGSVGGAPSGDAPQTQAPTQGGKKQQKKKDVPPPPPAQEEEEMDMGGLFD